MIKQQAESESVNSCRQNKGIKQQRCVILRLNLSEFQNTLSRKEVSLSKCPASNGLRFHFTQ